MILIIIDCLTKFQIRNTLKPVLLSESSQQQQQVACFYYSLKPIDWRNINEFAEKKIFNGLRHSGR